MSLRGLLAPIFSKVPNFAAGQDIDILHEMPVETLYLALKEADSQTALWFFQNGTPEQIQGLIDLDCWQGDQFKQDRFDIFFSIMTALHPVKLGELMKWLDPEVIVRGLIGYCEVLDFDPQNPPELPEENLLVTMDQKYVLVLKNTDPGVREALFLWINKCSAFDLSLLHRHLEACKWEQLSDLEEFAYQMKKGRLEELGFVEREEAISLYSRGQGALFKKELLDNPLPQNAKREAALADPMIDENFQSSSLNEQFLPEMITEPFLGVGFLAEAFKRLNNAKLAELLMQEIVRSINMSLVADEVIFAPLEDIKKSSKRAKEYLDLGLTYLADAQIDEATLALEKHPITKIHRLGWLLVQDITKATQEIRKDYPKGYFGEPDEEILNHLVGRHPELPAHLLQELGFKEAIFRNITTLYKVGAHVLHLSRIGAYFQTSLVKMLQLKENPLLEGENIYPRVMNGLFRLASGGNAESQGISREEWQDLFPTFDKGIFEKSIQDIIARAPEDSKNLLEKRLKTYGNLVMEGVESAKNNKNPNPRFFTVLKWAQSEEG